MNDIESPSPDLFYPRRDVVCTEPFSRFLSDYHATIDHFFFLIRLVAQADETRLRAAKALLPTAQSSEERERLEKSISEPDLVMNELKRHSNVNSRNLTNGLVNAFQRYFSSLVHSAALKRPEMMMSSEQISIEDILRFKRHKDLIAYIVDKKVNELAYGGLAELEKYFDKRLGIKMFSEKREKELLRLFIEVRNINVHNGGIVNDIFVSRVGDVDDFPYAKGDTFHVNFDALFALSNNAMKVALQIDATASTKFALKRQSHKAWRAGASQNRRSQRERARVEATENPNR